MAIRGSQLTQGSSRLTLKRKQGGEEGTGWPLYRVVGAAEHSPPCTPYSNEILQEISHKFPVGMAFRQKAPNFANFFIWKKAKFRENFSEIQA